MASSSLIQQPANALHPTAPPAAEDPRLLRLPRAITLWHLTSLDAPTVAITWSIAFARAAQVSVPLWLPVVLGLGTWAVYIGDRLLDSLRPSSPLRDRHHFHWRHRRLFLSLAVAASLAALALALRYMPLAARGRNSALATAAFLYFAGVHGRFRNLLPLPRLIPKELLVAIIFTAACATPTWARIPTALSLRLAMLPAGLCFILLAWLNCHAIEVWESYRKARRLTIFRLAAALSAACLAAALLLLALHLPRHAGLLATAAASAIGLGLLDRYRARLTPLALRASADLALLAPLALLAWR